MFDFLKNKNLKIWKGHEKDITKVVYCSKIDRALSASRDTTIKLWSQSSEKHVLSLDGHDLVVTALATNSGNIFCYCGAFF